MRPKVLSLFWVADGNISVNYVLWIDDVLNAHVSILRRPSNDVLGIDMFVFSLIPLLPLIPSAYSGTGSTAIYPILACKMNPGWKMIGTGTSVSWPHTFHINLTKQNLTTSRSTRQRITSTPTTFRMSSASLKQMPEARFSFLCSTALKTQHLV